MVLDDRTIRLDCTPQWLSSHLEHLSFCGVHLARGYETNVLRYVCDAIVPDVPKSLLAEDAALLERHIATDDTPAGLCLGFDRIPLSDATAKAMVEEASRQDFQPNHGAHYRLGRLEGRLVDVLEARAGSLTTTRFDPKIRQYSDHASAQWVGMHYDNALTDSREGERFPRSVRLEAAERRCLCNLGPGDRILILSLNMTALYLSDTVRPGDGDHVPDTPQLRRFLRAHPQEVRRTVCITVRLKPGDAVVFPAGIALHDGSTRGIQAQSRALVLAGRFPRRRSDITPLGRSGHLL
ncbi:hypothetical protein [Streptomyces sp. HUAS TT20]|uniref:hypothetical protein n=1 Tax=Streptomyces sp. HUAS TT20 TaxID=3447509 RepID=UPI0021D9CE2C|nr:hypothetical protein [Streptomyces sp. HUAS 15-9]UXY32218.1 hypothetical protein N8I87_40715 [Streptomyces sp. HUAS 15-9]